jgi:hypothetical protein
MADTKFARWQDEKRYNELLNKKNSNQQMTQSEDEELSKLEQTGNLKQGGVGIGNQYDKSENNNENKKTK